MKNLETHYQITELRPSFNIKGVYTIHYFKYGQNFKFEPETHNFWELVYIDSGEATIIAEDKVFKLKQGQAYFHKPNELHAIYTENRFANSVIISFECNSRAMHTFFGDKIMRFNDFEKQLLNKIVQEGKLSYQEKLNDVYLKKMTKKANAPFGGEQLIKNCIELLLISVARNASDKESSVDISANLIKNYSDKITENIINILHNNLYDKIDLNTIAKKMSFSKTYIKSVFKKETNTSIIQYYINLKIDEAKKLLSQNKYTVTEIAYMLKFNSVHYFSRQFKLQTDMSPTQYINSIKADNVLN